MKERPSSKWNFLRDHQRLQAVVRYQMERKGMTHHAAGILLGVHESEISKYLRGERTTSVNNFRLMTLCEKLGIEPTLEIKLNDKAI